MFGPSKRDLLRELVRERTQHRAEIQNLLDRIADISGKPWTLPPRPAVELREPEPQEIYEEY